MSPERWLRLEVELAAASASPELMYALSECLVAAGSNGTQEDGWCCVTYFQEPKDVAAFKNDTEASVTAEVGEPARFHWSWQPHEEWSQLWRQGFVPHDFGERLRVTPPWIVTPATDHRVVVVIDPGVAFGTAEHGSTRSCLTLLEQEIRGGETLLDVGAGSGVLAIAALKLGARSAVCVEVDEMACEALRENADRNGVASKIAVFGEPFGVDVAPGSYGIVVCNMVRSRLRPFLATLAKRVAPQGSLVLGGIQSAEHKDVLEDLAVIGPGWSAPRVFEDTGWLALHVTRLD